MIFHVIAMQMILSCTCPAHHLNQLSSLHTVVKDWVAVNFKICINGPEHTHEVLPALGSPAQYAVPTAKNLGVILD